jgi:hypothetical protein
VETKNKHKKMSILHQPRDKNQQGNSNMQSEGANSEKAYETVANHSPSNFHDNVSLKTTLFEEKKI